MTVDQESTEPAPPGPWDGLLDELHALRRTAGNPSYSELTRCLIEQRLRDGLGEHAARIAKSSVHDAFRMGRTRINVPLTREIVRLLAADPGLVDQWMAACQVDRAPATLITKARALVDELEQDPADLPLQHASLRQVVLLLVACVALNLFGRAFVDFFHLPIYLDMMGTAIAAIAIGPWRGAAVGATTNIVGIIGSGWVSLPFALVNIVGALVWGYGVRRWGLGRSLPRFFGLTVITALACSLFAVPILVALQGHQFRDGHDLITELMAQSIDTFVVVVSFSNILTSLADKMISAFVALVAISALPIYMRASLPLMFGDSTTPGPPHHR